LQRPRSVLWKRRYRHLHIAITRNSRHRLPRISLACDPLHCWSTQAGRSYTGRRVCGSATKAVGSAAVDIGDEPLW
jgi:hypothetical protein